MKYGTIIKSVSNRIANLFSIRYRSYGNERFYVVHSDAQGEPNNDRWELEIYKRDTQSLDFDEKNKGADYFGNKAGENFSDPK